MAYNIIKNIQALLAALTKEQYNQLMHDVVERTPDNKTFKDIKNVRNSQTFKQVFGNKQRIWIKAEGISFSDADDEARSIEAIQYETMVKDAYKTLLYINNIIIAVENEAKGNGSFSENLEKIRSHSSRNLQNNIKSWMQNIIYFYDMNDKIRQQKITGFVKMLKEKHAKYIDNVFVSSISDFDINMDTIYDNQIHKESAPADITPLLNNNDEMWICISRYPADVAAMSTDQNWTSCQNLDKDKNGKICYDKLNWHVKYDIMFGTCVAYTISKSSIDKSRAANPNNPLFPLLHPKARILIKPWFDANGGVYLSVGKDPVAYGNKNHFVPFINAVDDYLEQHQSNISGEFTLPDELYNDYSEDEYNTLIVKNGKIIDVTGKDEMMQHDPYNKSNNNEMWKALEDFLN